MDLGTLTLLLGMAALGFRHGFDWDHIAAITDITSTTSASHTEADVPAGSPMPAHGHEPEELRGHVHAHKPAGPGAMHAPSGHATQYGPKTAFGVGMIHGVGAETGSQALLLAGIAGVTGTTGVVILLAFVVGLIVSNTLVAVVTASGFIGAQRMRTIYVAVGFVAGLGSLLIGLLFVIGLGTALPDLQQILFGGRAE